MANSIIDIAFTLNRMASCIIHVTSYGELHRIRDMSVDTVSEFGVCVFWER